MLFSRRRLPALLACLLLGGSGCASWHVPAVEKTGWSFPAQRMSSDTVVLEIAFVRVPPELAGEAEALWKEVDEQAIDTQLRRRLNGNGLRCGIVGSQLPATLQRLFDQQRPLDLTSSDPDAVAQDAMRQHRLQSREGERSTVAAGPVRDDLHLFLNDDGSVRGETFSKAQCMFALRTFPKGDGRVRLEITPEIEHGEPRNRRVGQDGLWRLDFGRDRRSFETLRTEALLSPGRTLLITCTTEPVFLGTSFFARGPQDYNLLLVRLAQTQKDDLFDSASVAALSADASGPVPP
jgi:hypothetical protein